MMRWLGIKLSLVSLAKSTWTGGLDVDKEVGEETDASKRRLLRRYTQG